MFNIVSFQKSSDSSNSQSLKMLLFHVKILNRLLDAFSDDSSVAQSDVVEKLMELLQEIVK